MLFLFFPVTPTLHTTHAPYTEYNVICVPRRCNLPAATTDTLASHLARVVLVRCEITESPGKTTPRFTSQGHRDSSLWQLPTSRMTNTQGSYIGRASAVATTSERATAEETTPEIAAEGSAALLPVSCVSSSASSSPPSAEQSSMVWVQPASCAMHSGRRRAKKQWKVRGGETKRKIMNGWL